MVNELLTIDFSKKKFFSENTYKTACEVEDKNQ